MLFYGALERNGRDRRNELVTYLERDRSLGWVLTRIAWVCRSSSYQTRPRNGSLAGGGVSSHACTPSGNQSPGPWLGSDPQAATTTAAATDDAPLYPQRNIKRGAARGVDKLSRKELRDIEDAACDAGMRNPATVLGRWLSLVAVMAPVRAAFV